MSIGGNRAVKIDSELPTESEDFAMQSKKSWVYYNLVNLCELKLHIQAKNNPEMDSFDFMMAYFNNCAQYEKLFFKELRHGMRKKIYNDQIAEFSTNYAGIFHPYNPFLQKYHGKYMRSYQLFG